jgi:hypothetical protein
MPGAQLAPIAPRAKNEKHTSVVTTGTPLTGIPCAVVLTVSFALSPVTGLSCHRRSRGLPPRELDTSIGAPGPHDFTVRISAVRLRAPPRPLHPAPNVRDDRDTPLLRARDSFALFLFLPIGKAKNFCEQD